MKTIAGIRGRIGSTEYFIVTMKASEVVNSVRIPREMPDWDDITVEEKFQREINYKRVKEHIAPYLAEDKDRFFSALIVDVINGENVKFESLSDAGIKIPTIFSTIAQSVGILYLTGEELLVPLDGQHRLAAIKFAMYGKDEKDTVISGFVPNPEIGKDDITMILVMHDARKARQIFNKVNRYAKPTSKADNLISADDDAIAVISRHIVDTNFKGGRLVNIESNTLPDKSHQFTTLSVVYESTLNYIEKVVNDGKKINVMRLPADDVFKLWQQEAERLWKSFTQDVKLVSDALFNPDEEGDGKRVEIRKQFVIGKPVVQHIIICSIARLMESGVPLETAISRINKVDWRRENPVWQRILLNGEKIISGKQAVNLAIRFVSYYLGELQLEQPQLDSLLESYRELFDPAVAKTKNLPDVIQ